jgi:protocatechuate 3,4-dioxygenase, alpha subunit
VRSRVTPAQTIGPFFHGCVRAEEAQMVEAGSEGALEIGGRVLDGEGAPVTDALLELWQVDKDGGRFGRVCTDAQGEFRVVTRKPASLPGTGGAPQAPHILVAIFARGLLHRLVTRIYFPDEAAANARDPLLCAISPVERRALLTARGDGPNRLRFDVVLQGANETPFLDV